MYAQSQNIAVQRHLDGLEHGKQTENILQNVPENILQNVQKLSSFPLIMMYLT